MYVILYKLKLINDRFDSAHTNPYMLTIRS